MTERSYALLYLHNMIEKLFQSRPSSRHMLYMLVVVVMTERCYVLLFLLNMIEELEPALLTLYIVYVG